MKTSSGQKILYAGIGIGLYLIGQFGLNLLTGPDIEYKHKHFGDPTKHGRVTVYVEGVKFADSYRGRPLRFAGGAEQPHSFEDMVNDALKTFKSRKFLEQVGIEPTKGISELKIEVKK